jgi:hypothetical protein
MREFDTTHLRESMRGQIVDQKFQRRTATAPRSSTELNNSLIMCFYTRSLIFLIRMCKVEQWEYQAQAYKRRGTLIYFVLHKCKRIDNIKCSSHLPDLTLCLLIYGEMGLLEVTVYVKNLI